VSALPEVQRFWEDWRRFYGETGFVNARGDRLLTQLAIAAMEKLQPRMMMVNYNDPDYVHWGNPSHYTRGISVIDQGLRELKTAVDASDFYRDNTVFVIVPDCGRDSNRAMAVPFQHHFNTRSAHEIFALFLGPGIARGRVIDREVDQIAVAPTVARIMNMPAEFTEAAALDEVFA
jgi:phosphopentomutase